jgi:DNA-3-methyladenine glycosylase
MIAELQAVLQAGSLTAAKGLLGWKLTCHSSEGVASGYIVETEAYRADDPASHTYKGVDKRNAVMFGPAGGIYVYLSYGLHYCMNIVTGSDGIGEAVLIRAMEPVDGRELMMCRRRTADPLQLMSGPAKLTQALGVTLADNGLYLGEKLALEPGKVIDQVVQTTRVGITKAAHQPWRFYEAHSPYISRK